MVCLVARDERFCHNPAAALYTADTYAHRLLFGRPDHRRAEPHHQNDLDTLAKVSAELAPQRHEPWCRIQEAMEFARQIGATRLGISFCVGLRSEACLLTRVLEANGFEVASVCCKTGAVPKERLGVLDSQKVRPHKPEMMCNPIAQAELLNREDVELVLTVGQCVGHDAATLARLEAPAFCLIAKDRVLGHNSVAALYQRED